MNLPNRLTLIRMILVPFVAIFTLYEFTAVPVLAEHRWLIAGLLFGAAAVTDALDGNIARKRGLITDFGKLMDPVADKMLVMSVFICFLTLGLCSPWIVIIMLLREFVVTSIRMVAAGRGSVMAANKWGKAKTVTQTAAIGIAYAVMYVHTLVPENIAAYADIAVQVCFWAAAVMTLISGAIYVYESREIFLDA